MHNPSLINFSLSLLGRNDFVSDLNIRSTNTLSLEIPSGSGAFALIAEMSVNVTIRDCTLSSSFLRVVARSPSSSS